MSLPHPTVLYEAYGRELAGLLDGVFAGDLVSDPASVARQAVRVVVAPAEILWHVLHSPSQRVPWATCGPRPRMRWLVVCDA